jgi:hypothetical protein
MTIAKRYSMMISFGKSIDSREHCLTTPAYCLNSP